MQRRCSQRRIERILETLETRRLLCEVPHLPGTVPTRLNPGESFFAEGIEMPLAHRNAALAAAAARALGDQPVITAETGEAENIAAGESPNLAVLDVYMSDADGNEVATPAIGSYAYMQVEYSTVNIPAATTYTVRMTVGGQNIDYSVNWGSGGSGTGFWIMRLGVWMITPGFKAASVTLDVNNDVPGESNNVDNTASTNFNPAVVSPKFVAPLEGVPWQDWTLVNYVDTDLSAGVGDYNGGTWAYDGHNGWDYTVANWRDPDRYPGVDIYAAAGGVVVDAVDGNFDRNASAPYPPSNYVTIDHGNGFTTTYYHLRRDSVLVTDGQIVAAGQKIAEMGSSGRSTNPHLHWGVYYRGMQVEPGVGMSQYMAAPLTYAGQNPSVMDGGFISYNPSAQYYDGPVNIDNFNPGDTVWFWTVGGGRESGDTYRVRWYQPGGSTYATSDWTTGQGQYFYWNATLTAPNIPGLWSATAFINGVGMYNKSFTVQSAARPAEARMTLASDGSYIVDDRSTPYDFGTVTQGGTGPSLLFSFRVHNDGESNLTTSGLSVPSGFSVVNGLAATIAPGAFDTVSLVLDKSYDGYKAGWVSFNTNDADSGENFMRFRVEGTVRQLAVNTSSGADTVYIRRNGSNANIWVNTSTAALPTYVLPVSELAGVEFNTAGGDDQMTVDYTLGDPLGGTITFDGGSGNDTLTIIGDAASTTYVAGQSGVSVIGSGLISTSSLQNLIINAGNGNDTLAFNLAGLADDLDNIAYDTDFNGEGGADMLILNDTSDLGARTYDITALGVSRTGWSHDAAFFNTEAVILNANDSEGTINIIDGFFAHTADITINANGGSDTINVGSTSITNLDGAIAVNGGSGIDSVHVNDNGSFTADAWTIDNDNVLRGGFGGLTYGTVESLTVNAQSAGSTINVNSSNASTPLTINANGGADIINVLGHALGTEVLVDGGSGDDTLRVNTDNSGVARVRLAGDMTFGSVLVGAGGGLLMSNDGNAVLRTDLLSLDSAGFVDIANNNLIVDYTGATVLASVRAAIINGYNGGAWNGNGIRSSTAMGNPATAIGYAEASSIFGAFPASFAGQSIDNTTIAARFTLRGDANLDRLVDIGDFATVAANFNQTHKNWSDGDFDYNLGVDISDFAALASNFNTGLPRAAGKSSPFGGEPIESIAESILMA